LINGIRAVAGNLTEIVLAPVRNAVNGVKNFLGIGSPSRLFMAIGEDTMEGLQIGITRNPPDFTFDRPDISGAVNSLNSLRASTNLGAIATSGRGPINIYNENNTNADPAEIAAATAFRFITSGVV
jgi:hypothetical protein